MIEVVFNPSAYGKIKAHNLKKRKDDAGRTIIIDLDFMLGYGYISAGIESDYRIKLHTDFVMTGNHVKLTEEERRQYGDEMLRHWNQLIHYLEEGYPIRVWYSTNPNEYCGLLHVCTLLEQYDNQVTLVKCPEMIQLFDYWEFVHGWGQVRLEKTDHTRLSHLADKGEIRLYAERWKELLEENAPLRAVISGQVISVPEDFYDFLIRKEFPFKNRKEAELIGTIMGKSGIGIYNFWYKRRIQKMIEDGEIRVVKDAEKDMRRRLTSVQNRRT